MKTLQERFWAKVQKTETCWLWTSTTAGRGYGTIHLGRRGDGVEYAHRLSYSWAHGEIPAGMDVCHHCDNMLCVNPAHLFLGTRQDNILDAKRKGRLACGDRNGTRIHPETVRRGEKNSLAKLTAEQVLEIRSRRGCEFQKDTAAEFNISQQLVSLIQTRKVWAHV